MIAIPSTDPTARTRSARASAPWALRAWAASSRYRPVLALLVILVAVFWATLPVFRTEQNIQNLLTGVSVLWIVAMGMTFALISGGVDISTGALIGLCGYFLAELSTTGIPQVLLIVGVVAFGGVIGALVNGLLIGRFRLDFFVVTLASLTAMTGILNLWSGTLSKPVNSSIVNDLAVSRFLGLQGPIWIMIVTFLVAVYVQRYTYLGRDIYATGGSLQAANLSGINTTRTLIVVYGIVGVAAALASLLTVSRIGVASPQVDNNLPLAAIAAALLGGTALGGGTGGVEGTVFGVLFVGVLANGLDLAGVPSFWQQVVTGGILIAAVIGNRPGVGSGALRRRLLRSGLPRSAAGERPA